MGGVKRDLTLKCFEPGMWLRSDKNGCRGYAHMVPADTTGLLFRSLRTPLYQAFEHMYQTSIWCRETPLGGVKHDPRYSVAVRHGISDHIPGIKTDDP